METKRLILWIIFSFSIMLMWNKWQDNAIQNISNKSIDIKNGNTSIPEHINYGKEKCYLDNSLEKYHSDDVINIKNDVLDLTFDCLGAQIIKANLIKYPSINNKKEGINLLNISDKKIYVVQSGLINDDDPKKQFPNHLTVFKFNKDKSTLEGDLIEILFEAEKNNLLVVKKFLIEKNSYNIKVIHELHNNNATPISSSLYLQIERDANLPEGGSNLYKTFTGFAVFSNQDKFQKISFDDIRKNKQKYIKESNDGWIAMVQQYFTTAWIPTKGINHRNEVVKIDGFKDTFLIRTIEPIRKLELNETTTTTSNLWIGPQDQNSLAEISKGLDLVVDYGFFTIIAKPLFFLLTLLHRLLNNWGWSIVLLTVIIKLIFFPLASASYRSMAKLKDIGPKIQSIKDRYGDDKQKFNSALMELYKKEKINPLGGCLPTIVQIPVFIALYWVLLASVEMRGAPWILWIRDLSEKDPLFILPILMMLTMFLQMKLNPSPADPIQAKVMMLMPIVFGFMMFFFPSGLVLYWCVNNTISIIQQWFITKKLS